MSLKTLTNPPAPVVSSGGAGDNTIGTITYNPTTSRVNVDLELKADSDLNSVQFKIQNIGTTKIVFLCIDFAAPKGSTDEISQMRFDNSDFPVTGVLDSIDTIVVYLSIAGDGNDLKQKD